MFRKEIENKENVCHFQVQRNKNVKKKNKVNLFVKYYDNFLLILNSWVHKSNISLVVNMTKVKILKQIVNIKPRI